jgi:hypothetical protein
LAWALLVPDVDDGREMGIARTAYVLHRRLPVPYGSRPLRFLWSGYIRHTRGVDTNTGSAGIEVGKGGGTTPGTFQQYFVPRA